jgi:hypothetical protein
LEKVLYILKISILCAWQVPFYALAFDYLVFHISKTQESTFTGWQDFVKYTINILYLEGIYISVYLILWTLHKLWLSNKRQKY